MAKSWQNVKTGFYLKDEIKSFIKLKGNPVPEFDDWEWISDFAFLVDLTGHLNELNIKLQGKNQMISAMFDHIQ